MTGNHQIGAGARLRPVFGASARPSGLNAADIPILSAMRRGRRRGLFGAEYAKFMGWQKPSLRDLSRALGPSGPARAIEYVGSDATDLLDRRLADLDGGGDYIEIGTRRTPQNRRAWEKQEGRDWPRDPVTGRPYDVSHIRALADGGTDTVDNIEPLHPDEHRSRHKESGDSERWGKRAGIARAFGGRVARVLGPFGIVPDITGVLSGRIRTNNFDNFTSDLFGWQSREDRLKKFEREQKAINPNWKWGDPYVI